VESGKRIWILWRVPGSEGGWAELQTAGKARDAAEAVRNASKNRDLPRRDPCRGEWDRWVASDGVL
jgi:hypothetical protein